ncbi:hypothetical protein KIN20_024635 [Parelaphostrongylus tenuis]|uniref:7TM GPCR serpentine receptor class x (Srx) domain-containing protein n=1 Tax=Parelaphostrongylus tenuis TaxID=148309 RepID=A0AAD5NCX5_PARTN|nr:hypothetical protein KIN20_024635 [Parelaphostrongylus tenuis]
MLEAKSPEHLRIIRKEEYPILYKFPLQVTSLLIIRNTSLVVLICWVLGFFHAIPYFWTWTCFISFDTAKWMWKFSDATCHYSISINISFFITSTLVLLIIVFDCITLISLKVKHKERKSRGPDGTYPNFDQRKRKRWKFALLNK